LKPVSLIATLLPAGFLNPGGMRMTKIIPALRYRDAPKAIEWLCHAFSFEKHLVVPGKQGKVEHAQLTLADQMIMLGSVKEGEFDKYIALPGDIGGRSTATLYVVVDDPDAHHARALRAGAKIIREPTDQDYGGRDYSCLDIEGHVWSFGTYDPWKSA
jgi:uncharacterized glyoxalase superfamily protein PhnB